MDELVKYAGEVNLAAWAPLVDYIAAWGWACGSGLIFVLFGFRWLERITKG